MHESNTGTKNSYSSRSDQSLLGRAPFLLILSSSPATLWNVARSYTSNDLFPHNTHRRTTTRDPRNNVHPSEMYEPSLCGRILPLMIKILPIAYTVNNPLCCNISQASCYDGSADFRYNRMVLDTVTMVRFSTAREREYAARSEAIHNHKKRIANKQSKTP